MIQAIDTNVLVYAYREEMSRHNDARSLVHRLSEGDTPWAIPVFCISEFLRVVTHRGIFHPPTPLEDAVIAIEHLLQSPSVRLLLPGDRYWSIFSSVLHRVRVSGNVIFDAQIVALCLEHGVQTIISEDRDLRGFDGIEAVPIA